MNNRKIFIFDVDGTLTPSRLPMTKEFQTFFSDWVKQNTFYLVTGSDLPKLQEQMNGMEIHSNGIFTCCGNQFWETDYAVHPKHADLIYENKFKIPQTLLTYLGLQVRLSDTPVMSTNHREDRGSMLNFSVVGRNCTQEQREEYFEWDNKVGERRKIANEIMSGWPELEAVLGGQISIDIYPKGKDKSQIYEHLEEKENIFCPDEYIFIGDRTEKGGNDYPLAKLMEETSSCNYYRTKGWEHTQQILENLID
jgi:phosphomannomutase